MLDNETRRGRPPSSGTSLVNAVRQLGQLTGVGIRDVWPLSLASAVVGILEATVLVLIAAAAVSLGQDLPVDVPILGTLSIASATSAGLVLAGVVAGLRLASEHRQAALIAQAEARLRIRVLSAYQQADTSRQREQTEGGFMALVSGHCGRVVDLLAQLLGAHATALVALLYLAAATFLLPSAILVLGALVVVLATAQRPLALAGERASTKAAEEGRRFGQVAIELVTHRLETRAAGRDAAMVERAGESAEALAATSRRSMFLKRVATALQWQLIMIGALVTLRVVRTTDQASLTTIGPAVLLSIRAAQQLRPTGAALHHLRATTAFQDELQAVVARLTASRRPGSRRLTDPVQRLRLADVRVHRGGRTVLVCDQLEVSLDRSLAITGPSGAGKTTLLRVLAGLDRPTHGTVLADSIPLAEYEPASLAKLVGFVPQSPKLFSATIMENVTLFDPSIGEDDVWWALDVAQLSEVVSSLADGVQTPVGDRLLRGLSGGQVQRLSIARALVRRPRWLLLDEPTSGLDQAAEEALVAALEAISETTTPIVVTHRPGTMALCDDVLVVRDGHVSKAPRGDAAGFDDSGRRSRSGGQQVPVERSGPLTDL